jgi:uncharacterized protein (TIGR02611 family)
MSPGAEGSDAPDAELGTATLAPGRPTTPGRPAARRRRGSTAHVRDHHLLLDPHEDRWAWRRRIRQNPHKLAVYRFAVGLAGLFLICLGFVSGPIPGPGGIPLVLLGLAVWSSEFEWAYRLMHWFKLQLKRYGAWPRHRQVLFWVAFFACCGLIGYSYLLLTGVPRWLPGVVEMTLLRLPGL